MKYIRAIFALIFLLLTRSVFSQDVKYKGLFSAPLTIPLSLAGNFSELRTNHFHGGLDIKTDSKEGQAVLAAADGYVSKIKISASGFGNVMYLKHGGKYMTVYGHLRNFRKNIDQYIKMKQYENQCFAIEIEMPESLFPVKKGDTIAFSGNSGSSSGPHLHFEIRDFNSEISYNPLLFGFDIVDKIPPVIEGIEVFPLSDNSKVNGQDQKKIIAVKRKGGTYVLSDPKMLNLSGDIGFAVMAFDRLNGSGNKCGVFSIELKIDGKRVYYYCTDQLLINDTRYILSHIDYPEKVRHNRSYQKSFIAPGNLMKTYHDIVNHGIINFSDDSVHQVSDIVCDANGNISYLDFKVRSHRLLKNMTHKKHQECSKLIPCLTANTFTSKDIDVNFPDIALFDTLCFQYSTSPALKNTYSPLIHVHNGITPLFRAITLNIHLQNIPARMRNKLLVASVIQENNKTIFHSIGGSLKDSIISASTREFGNFTVIADTISPVIKPVNISRGKNLSSAGEIKFIISDNLSGIGSFNGFIDGKWVLFNYDEKRKLIWYDFDESRLEKGKSHRLLLKVSDNLNNESVYSSEFFW
ncbi:MAG: M23 family metallopeptidase [Bacteroidia bacterium]|nr:M23 family metallopeptidase [Bacteroidia bacterium]